LRTRSHAWRMAAALAALLLSAQAQSAPTASRVISKAEEATNAMYAWYCQGAAASPAKPLCVRNELLGKIRAATAAADKASLAAQLKKVGTTGLSKEYLEMKQRFCATPGAKVYTLCQQPTKSYNTSRRVKRDNSSTLMYTWLCGKDGLSDSQRGLCTRNELTEKLKVVSKSSGSTTERDALMKQLRITPFNSVAYQAVTAEYCALGRNMDSLVCRSVKSTREGKELTNWHCKPASSGVSADGGQPWCEMTALYAQLKEVPPTDVAKRKPILTKIIELRKRAGKTISEEYSAALKKFCVGRETYEMCLPDEDSYNSYDG